MAVSFTYNTRLNDSELFIDAPNNDAHQRAFAQHSPDAKYDQVLAEWRLPWNGEPVDQYIIALTSLIESNPIEPEFHRITEDKGIKYGYAQSTVGEGAEIQIDALSANNISDTRIFYDKLEGRNPATPKLSECLDLIRSGDVLYVWNLNRLARSLKQLSEALQAIQDGGAHLVSLDEKIDSREAEFKNFVTHITYASNFEKEANKIRTSAGIKEAAAKGRIGGRKFSLSRQQLEMMVQAILNGVDMDSIADMVKLTPSSVYRNLPGGPTAIKEIYESEGDEGVQNYLDRLMESRKMGITPDIRNEIIQLSKNGMTVPEIVKRTSFNRETIRAIIKEGDN